MDSNNSHHALKDVKVLVAESNFSQSRLYLKLLQEERAETTLVCAGYEALDTVNKDLYFYDAIVMDFILPDINGLEATYRLRELGYSGAIIALTAYGLGELKQTWLKAGCNEYLEKPFYKKEFIRAVARHTTDMSVSLG